MKELKPVKEGKVREVYDTGDAMIIVATDRTSAGIYQNEREKGYFSCLFPLPGVH